MLIFRRRVFPQIHVMKVNWIRIIPSIMHAGFGMCDLIFDVWWQGLRKAKVFSCHITVPWPLHEWNSELKWAGAMASLSLALAQQIMHVGQVCLIRLPQRCYSSFQTTQFDPGQSNGAKSFQDALVQTFLRCSIQVVAAVVVCQSRHDNLRNGHSDWLQESSSFHVTCHWVFSIPHSIACQYQPWSSGYIWILFCHLPMLGVL